jgi:hypothetical protein
MIILILSVTLCLIFTLLGGFHFYWLFGGTWGLNKVIPSQAKQANTLAIPKFATLIVAVVLVAFGAIYLLKANLITVEAPIRLVNYSYWFIPAIFLLRAVGEFKYVGFFKKIKDTEFAKADSKLFSPLCLGLALAGILIQLL